MPKFDEAALTAEVLASFSKTANPRLRTLITEAVRSLHDFVQTTGLSFEEWSYAIEFLTAIGQNCTPVRQEFILLSDVLGVSMLVDAVNHREREGATETTVLGPFYVGEHKTLPNGANISAGIIGEPMFVTCRVEDQEGNAMTGVAVDVWHADDEGFYDSQKSSYADEGPSLRARFLTEEGGLFRFRTILPCSYPIPLDGPVGELISAAGRHPMRPAHIHFLVAAPGFDPLVTHVFIGGDPFLTSDVVFGVKDELIAVVEKRTDPILPDGSMASGPWYLMNYTFRMKPGRGIAPRPMSPGQEERTKDGVEK